MNRKTDRASFARNTRSVITNQCSDFVKTWTPPVLQPFEFSLEWIRIWRRSINWCFSLCDEYFIEFPCQSLRAPLICTHGYGAILIRLARLPCWSRLHAIAASANLPRPASPASNFDCFHLKGTYFPCCVAKRRVLKGTQRTLIAPLATLTTAFSLWAYARGRCWAFSCAWDSFREISIFARKVIEWHYITREKRYFWIFVKVLHILIRPRTYILIQDGIEYWM